MNLRDEILAPCNDNLRVNADNPWPGLLPFGEADQAYFHGRQAETEDLLRLVMRERLTVLFGLSGLGKSSLLQAGLFPRLPENLFPVYIRLDFSPQRPKLILQVKEAVARKAASAGIEAPVEQESETLWEYFHSKDADFWNRKNRPVVPLLVFDQFEEIFTLGRRDPQCAEAVDVLLNALADLAEGRPPVAVKARIDEHPDEALRFSFGRHQYKILLAIREDFLPDLEALRERISAVALNRLRLRRMNGEAALLVVNHAPHLIDSSVAEEVVRRVAAGRPGVPLVQLEVEPALLSVVCRELNSKRRERGEPKITADLLEGNQEEVLNDFYENSFANLSPEVRFLVEEMLLTVSGYRDSVALENALRTQGVSREAIDQLIGRRLVRIEERDGVQRLELTHDLLTPVVRASRDRRRQVEAADRERVARREAEERERRTLQQLRRSRLVATALLAFALLALGAAVWAVAAQVEVKKQRARAETQASQARRAAQEEETARKAAEREKARAEEAKRQAEKEKQKAEASEEEAIRQRRRAEEQANQAATAAQQEQEARQLAEAERRRAEEERRAAALQAAEADRQRQIALKAQQQEVMQRKEVARALARSDVQDAARLVDLNRGAHALEYLARAIRGDSESISAKSWIFDLLIRGSGLLPGEPLRREDRVYSFDHEPLQHQERVLSAAFGPDGRRVVTASWDNSAQVWDVDRGTRIGPHLRHHSLVNSAAFSPDGRRVVTASWDNSAQVWNADTGEAVGQPLQHDGPVTWATFSPDGRRVVTASEDKTARIWNAEGSTPIGQPMRHQRPVNSAVFSSDGHRVVTASWDSTAQVWDADSGRPVGPPLQHQRQVNFAAFSPDGRRVVTASDDSTARVWEADRPVGETLRHKGAVNSAAFSPDGRRVVTASDDSTARVWEADTGTPVGAPLRHQKRVNFAAFSPDGRRVVTASDDKTARVWEVWFDFDDARLLADFAEALGGYQAERLPDLVPLLDPQERLNKLRQLAARAPESATTASFVRWFLSRSRKSTDRKK